MIKNSRFFGCFDKFVSQRCNTQMLRSSHKEMSLRLTIIRCIAATTHKFVNNTSILLKESNSFKLKLKESLLISRDKPILNKKIYSFPLELFDWLWHCYLIFIVIFVIPCQYLQYLRWNCHNLIMFLVEAKAYLR